MTEPGSYCTDCGAKIDPTSKFCSSCGRSTSLAAAKEEEEEKTMPPGSKSSSNDGHYFSILGDEGDIIERQARETDKKGARRTRESRQRTPCRLKISRRLFREIRFCLCRMEGTLLLQLFALLSFPFFFFFLVHPYMPHTLARTCVRVRVCQSPATRKAIIWLIIVCM
jgi:hypothetical protein